MEIPGLNIFLVDYPEMTVSAVTGDLIDLKGEFRFEAGFEDNPVIRDCYDLEIQVPMQFPKDLPKVFETGGRLPHTGEFHVNTDGSLCLGSPIRLLILLSEAPTLPGFAERCLIPFLYGMSYRRIFKTRLIFGELAHGKAGLMDDYKKLFGLNSDKKVEETLRILSMNERRARKRPCPCGCGHRLDRCKFWKKLKNIRRLATPEWFRQAH